VCLEIGFPITGRKQTKNKKQKTKREATSQLFVSKLFLYLFIIKKNISQQKKIFFQLIKNIFQSKKFSLIFKKYIFSFDCVFFPESNFQKTTFQTFLCLFAIRKV